MKSEEKKISFMFNSIAPIYALFHKSLCDEFKENAELLNAKIPLSGLRILDVGTGTGAWAGALKHAGAESVHGIDISEKMLVQAQKKKIENITYSLGNAVNLEQFADDSFDIVTASLVMHGSKAEYRKQILNQINRVSKKNVVFADFYGKTPRFEKFLEFMEGSDYKNFKLNFEGELNNHFKNIEIIPLKQGRALYIAEK
jgi:ubiquinone/menaquinone biosynthesis C-methylase UbiE